MWAYRLAIQNCNCSIVQTRDKNIKLKDHRVDETICSTLSQILGVNLTQPVFHPGPAAIVHDFWPPSQPGAPDSSRCRLPTHPAGSADFGGQCELQGFATSSPGTTRLLRELLHRLGPAGQRSRCQGRFQTVKRDIWSSLQFLYIQHQLDTMLYVHIIVLQKATCILMDLLLGSEVTGGMVSSQLDVTSQQHLFLLGQNGAHFLSVMHQTQTQIILPDLSAPQSPSSLLIQGSPDGVCLARQQLMVQCSV